MSSGDSKWALLMGREKEPEVEKQHMENRLSKARVNVTVCDALFLLQAVTHLRSICNASMFLHLSSHLASSCQAQILHPRKQWQGEHTVTRRLSPGLTMLSPHALRQEVDR